MTKHVLKSWPDSFRDVSSGAKCFEWRKNDRQFQASDTLLLREWSPPINVYTGHVLEVRVTFIQKGGQFGIPEDYCILGIERGSP